MPNHVTGNGFGGDESLPRHRSGDAAFHRTSMYGLPSPYTVAAAYRCTGGGQNVWS
ncbi:hypothetical protein BIFPSEUDO_02489 [Bifidobacterium pseudocatenulatum DSM 20438 = JCM 1200 = LMG 10505]|uniref:Uncharacterized protein n=1 Tax=Bifidobacterium pseudocatenulatum DSM 20438 = JCM 1200 = LMG 10505 TaxID=547043 RepID=C0BQ49_BIFPS|nr:hypothetical protein BIFPSEUDO_02489 [Bifidobacterium pseudocatenulatum DSM 20438 = JCM 1200 = LMG 10505]